MKEVIRRVAALVLAMAMSLSLLSANVWAAELEPAEDGSASSVQSSEENEGHSHGEEAPEEEEEKSSDEEEESSDEEEKISDRGAESSDTEEESPDNGAESSEKEEKTSDEGEQASDDAAVAPAETPAEPDGGEETPEADDEEAEKEELVTVEGEKLSFIPEKYKNLDPMEAMAAYDGESLSVQDDEEPGYAGSRLTGNDLKVYKALRPQIAAVAAGDEDSTEFEVTAEDLGLPQQWTAEDLGVYQITPEIAGRVVAEKTDFHLNAVVNALLADEPFRLFWYDKTAGCTGSLFYYQYSSTYLKLKGSIVLQFYVSTDYSANGAQGSFQADTEKCGAVSAAAASAYNIVNEHAGESDFRKLSSYRKEICDRVSYNDDAADDENTPYGDPWQCVWVFDNDDTTNVVCEGYSKAFQYLCDSSEFKNGNVRCISVGGDMDGGAHMWNVVRMEDNANYLVDVTNCDEGSIGAPDKLFLVGAQGSVEAGYTCVTGDDTTCYVYDDDTKDTFDEGDLELSGMDYVSQEDQGDYCGDDLTWSLKNGDLTIDGTGPMWDYGWDDETGENRIVPWNRAEVRTVVIGVGVTSIGQQAFYDCGELSSVTFSGLVGSIGERAFEDCRKLATVNLEAGQTYPVSAFRGTPWWAKQQVMGEFAATQTLNVPWELTIQSEDAENYFTFTAGQAGEYRFFSTGDAGVELNVRLYDGSFDEVYSTYDTNISTHFDAEAGEQFCVLVRANEKVNSPFSTTFTVTKDEEPVSGCEHAWGKGEVTKEANCHETGTMTYTCTLCGTTKPKEIPVNPDNHDGDIELRDNHAATCVADGYTGDTWCLGCNTKTGTGEVIPATGNHTWKKGEVTKKANCHETGAMTYICTVCGATKPGQIPIDSNNHDGGTELRRAREAGVNQPGYTGDTCCKGCDAVLQRGVEIPALPAPAEKAENVITAANVVRGYSTKKQTLNLGASALEGAALSYASNNGKVQVNEAGTVTIAKKFAGTVNITITAAETGSYKLTQKVITLTVPTAAKLSKVTTAKGQMTVQWKKNNTGNGYEVQYSTDKKFKKKVKKVKVKKVATVKTTVKKLKKGTYYIRIRTMNGKYVSDWSKLRMVKITK